MERLQKNWDEFGKTDPLWAVIALPDKKDNKWDINEFFATGEREIDAVMRYIKSLGLNNNSFDFIYTTITLQHMEPRYSKSYIKEFLRILVPHGVLIFQLPSHPKIINETRTINLKGLILRLVPKSLLDATYRKVKYGNQPRMEGYWIKRQKVVEFLERNGARIIDIEQNHGKIMVVCRYCVTKG